MSFCYNAPRVPNGYPLSYSVPCFSVQASVLQQRCRAL